MSTDAGEVKIASPGDTIYYIDPGQGDDGQIGLRADRPWRTFQPVNARRFAPGDRIEILAPGAFHETLMPTGAGTAAKPITIRFAPGAYDFHPDGARKLPLHISNTNDDPLTPKAIALLFRGVRQLQVVGDRTDIFVHGKMIYTLFDQAADIRLDGIAFDYRRPLVSEFTVLTVASDHADVQVHTDSCYAIEHGQLAWLGEGWRSAGICRSGCVAYDPVAGRLWHRNTGPLTAVTKVTELAPFRLRLFFGANPGFVAGHVFQFREIHRDCAAGLVNRSANLTWTNGAYHALGGLGIVSQFSENLNFERMIFAPRPDSGRTNAGWADFLHFSGCRGTIRVADCRMSGSHDDPINVHGTHLRIVGRPAPDRILVRFMHPQTYGIEAFVPGDEIEFVKASSLRAYAVGGVTAVEAVDDKNILLTLAGPAPSVIGEHDVIENITWTPSVEVRNCHVALTLARGFLLTTRRPILVENNTFVKTCGAAIDISDDANSWFESGPVRDVTIRGNRFLQCGSQANAPAIRIIPENSAADPAVPVHRNIRILDNDFDLEDRAVAVDARSVQGLTITGNRSSTPDLPVRHEGCTEVTIENNQTDPRRLKRT